MNEVQGPAPEDFPEGWTLLHDAVLRDDLPCAEALLAEGADARAASRNFCIWECTGTPPPEEPVVHGGNPMGGFSVGTTPLHVAARLGHVALMAPLLRAGADPNALDRCGATPLHLAASGGRVEAIRWLVEQGVALDCVTTFATGMSRHEQITALHAALESGSLAACELLVAAGPASPTERRTDVARSSSRHAEEASRCWGTSCAMASRQTKRALTAIIRCTRQ